MSAIERALADLVSYQYADRRRFEQYKYGNEDRVANTLQRHTQTIEAAHAELAELRTENEKLKRAWLATYYEDGNA